eukprot:m.103676 g.103676  ORF g.103676 m.103676 type:complete len:193 (-) comp12620_c2_seq1:1538-2116(-)
MSSSNIKHNWYQTDDEVVLSIALKKLTKDDVMVEFKDRSFAVTANMPDNSVVTFSRQLYSDIEPEKCTFRVPSMKVELKMAKKTRCKWESLEEQEKEEQKHNKIQKSPDDWEKLSRDVEAQEKEEPGPQGEQAMQKLLQQVFKDADEDTQRAMMKSYLESNGTVLSTNWKEVGEKKVDMQKPEGVEFRKYGN